MLVVCTGVGGPVLRWKWCEPAIVELRTTKIKWSLIIRHVALTALGSDHQDGRNGMFLLLLYLR